MPFEDVTASYYGLKIERDVSLPLRDGSHLVADVFRPDGSGRFPTIVTMGPYSKDIHFQDWNRTYDYARLPERGPYMHWETVNPEWWVPGLRGDSRRRPGHRKVTGPD